MFYFSSAWPQWHDDEADIYDLLDILCSDLYIIIYTFTFFNTFDAIKLSVNQREAADTVDNFMWVNHYEHLLSHPPWRWWTW